MIKRRIVLVLMACFLGMVAACSDESKDDETLRELENKKAPLPICPQVAILRELALIHDFGTSAPEPSELVASGQLKGVNGHCDYGKFGIDISFDLSMTAIRGKRLGGNHTSFPFFVALVDPTNTIVDKELLTADFDFAENSKTSDHVESLHVFIPIARENRNLGPDYRVLMGFQVPNDQLHADHPIPTAKDPK